MADPDPDRVYIAVHTKEHWPHGRFSQFRSVENWKRVGVRDHYKDSRLFELHFDGDSLVVTGEVE